MGARAVDGGDGWWKREKRHLLTAVGESTLSLHLVMSIPWIFDGRLFALFLSIGSDEVGKVGSDEKL